MKLDMKSTHLPTLVLAIIAAIVIVGLYHLIRK